MERVNHISLKEERGTKDVVVVEEKRKKMIVIEE
jgi:hypothetical protein